MLTKLRVIAIATLVAMSCGAHCFAQKVSNDFPRFTLAEGSLDTNGFPTSGAKLCLLKQTDVCYQMPPQQAASSVDETYQFGLDPRSERLPLKDGGSWVFFLATFSGGGSGMLERVAVLRYEPNGSLKNLMPYVAATNVSQRAMWSLPEASSYPILVHADFLWDKNETHFGDHFYMVEAWVYDSAKDQYARAFEYKTSQRYGGGDEIPVRVLQGERSQILRRLGVR